MVAGVLLAACATLAHAAPPDRAPLDRRFAADLAELADRCDTLQLPAQARLTRAWAAPRDPRRNYLFLPAESAIPYAVVDPGEPLIVQQWRRRFLELRRKQAEGLVDLAREALGEPHAPHADLAYQWLHEALREDPDCLPARQTLGYRVVNGRWRRLGSETRSRLVRTVHPITGWAAQTHWRIESPHYDIATNASEEAGLALAARLETWFDLWRQVFFEYWGSPEALRRGLDQPLTSARSLKKFRVVLASDRQEYLRLLRSSLPQADLTTGIYLDRSQTVFFYSDESTPANWRHEAAHQLFYELAKAGDGVGRDANFWLVEAVALYWESLVERDGYYTVGGFDAERLQYARYRALVERSVTSLDELSSLGREAWQNDPQIRRRYTQAAGLAHFLMDGHDRQLRSPLVRALLAVHQGRGDRLTLARLANVDYATLDQAYLRFLDVADDELAWLGPPEVVTKLCLSRTSVTAAGVARLAGYEQLAWLDLAGVPVDSATLTSLGPLPRLEQLNLEATRVDDDAAAWLAALPKLQELDLSHTAITDRTLRELAQAAQLATLWIGGARTTPAGLAALKQARPGLAVE